MPASLSVRVDHDDGNVISNKPKKESANARKMAKKNKLVTGFTEILYSVVSPKINVSAVVGIP